ncbi:phosphotransferase [Nocardioides sp. NPDC006303]|uniref:phosphotransferase n=1 Tax=Nocardioides sp. NPDC006303 TaxID=3156747 RepID=UPI0033B36A34
MREDVTDLTPETVRALLYQAWGLVPDRLDVMSGEIATVCRVRVGGELLAVKSLPGTPDDGALVNWQTEAVAALAAAGLPVPGVLPTVDGALVHESVESGRQVFTTVSAWLPDPPLATVDVDQDLLRAVGVMTGRVSATLATFPAPPVPAQHEWELLRTADTIRAVLDRVVDPHVASLASLVAARHDTIVRSALGELPHSVVHHDLHDDNLLVGRTPTGGRGITGILDFGDMVVGPRIAEYVVAAAYVSRHTADPVSSILEVARGWHGEQPLSAAERRVLLTGVQSRLALNAAVWSARSAGPRGSYASSRSAGTVEALERLLAVDPASFESRLRSICPE